MKISLKYVRLVLVAAWTFILETVMTCGDALRNGHETTRDLIRLLIFWWRNKDLKKADTSDPLDSSRKESQHSEIRNIDVSRKSPTSMTQGDSTSLRSRSSPIASVASSSSSSSILLVPIAAAADPSAAGCVAKVHASGINLPKVVTMFPSTTQPPLWPPKSLNARSSQKVLALDLDHTLLCTSLNKADYARPPDFSEVVASIQGAQLFHVWLRPHMDLFLDVLSQMYNIVIFTASAASYADVIIDRLDRGKRRIKKRFFRSHCVDLEQLEAKKTEGMGPAPASEEQQDTASAGVKTLQDGNNAPTRKTSVVGGGNAPRYGKDLTVLDVPLRSVILVDNDHDALSVNPENGLLVPSYFPPKAAASPRKGEKKTAAVGTPEVVQEEETDETLLSLLPLLEALYFTSDVRSILRFGLSHR